MKDRLYIFLFCFVFLAKPFLISQTLIQSEHLTIKDGLSQGFISALHQDSEGFLWIGTKNGLNRYDGEQFEIFTHDPGDPYSISHDWVKKLYEVEGCLLVSTTAGGLGIFHKKSKRFYKIPSNNPDLKSWEKMDIRHLCRDASGQFWILEEGTNLLIWLRFPENFWQNFAEDTQLLQQIEISGFPDLGLTAIGNGGSDYMYGLNKSYDLLRGDIRSGNWEILDQSLSEYGPLGFTFDVEHNLFAFTHLGNKILYLKEGEWLKSEADFQIHKLFYLEKEKQLWLSSAQEFVMFEDWAPGKKFLKRSEASAVVPVSNGTINNMVVDRSGVIWLGTGGYGVLKVTSRLLKIKKYFEGNSVYAPPYMTEKGEILVSTVEGPLLKTAPLGFIQNFPNVCWWLEGEKGSIWLVGKVHDKVEIHRLEMGGRRKKLQR